MTYISVQSGGYSSELLDISANTVPLFIGLIEKEVDGSVIIPIRMQVP